MIAVLCTLTLLQGPGWSHVVPPPGAAGEHAPLRALALVAERPEGVEEKVDYRGHRRRYTQVRYGAAGTTRIAIAFDEVDCGQVELYVDADRDRAITAADRVPGAGPRWRLALELVTTSADDGPRLERPALLQAEVGSGDRASRATRTPPRRDPGRRAGRRADGARGFPAALYPAPASSRPRGRCEPDPPAPTAKEKRR